MKPIHGFSPLSVATLVVASVWLPIVLFPYGGAILMNIVFVYGFREYRANKGEDIFRIFTWITAFTCALFLLIAFVVPFEPAYRLLREAALLGPILRENLPSGQALTVFQWVVFGALLCANPLITNDFRRGVAALGAPLPKAMIVRAQYFVSDRFGVVPIACFFLIFIQIMYLAGFGDNFEPSGGRERYRKLQKIDDEISTELIFLMLNFVTFVFITLYSNLRALAKDIGGRKF